LKFHFNIIAPTLHQAFPGVPFEITIQITHTQQITHKQQNTNNNDYTYILN
jgi:hypothetical protein